MNNNAKKNKQQRRAWRVTKIGTVCTLIGGGTPPRKHPEYFGEDIVWLTPSEIHKTKLKQIYGSREKITNLGLKHSSAKLIPAGAVLLTTRASIGYVAIAGTRVTTNQGFTSFVCSDSVYNFYLAYWLRRNQRLLNLKARGTTFKEISKSSLREFNIPLPPIAEQKQIVGKIESIFTKIDAVKNHLEKIQMILKQARQSVLKATFGGKLLSLDRQNQGKSRYRRIALGDIISPSTTRFNPMCSKSLKCVGLEHIESNTGKLLNHIDSKLTSSTKSVFFKGDILYGRLRPYLNKVCVANIDGVCSTDILVFSQQPGVESRYLAYCMLSAEFVTYTKLHSSGVQHPRVKYSDIARYEIPLPSYGDQIRLVTKIDAIFNEIESIEKHTTNAVSLLDSLKYSVLKQAFDGKLTSQYLDGESSTSSLEKITQNNHSLTKNSRRLN